jgi:hypothetical protein
MTYFFETFALSSFYKKQVMYDVKCQSSTPGSNQTRTLVDVFTYSKNVLDVDCQTQGRLKFMIEL